MLSCRIIKGPIKLLRSISSLSSSTSGAVTSTTTTTPPFPNGLITKQQLNPIANQKNNDNNHQFINFLPQSISLLGIENINIQNNWNEMNRRGGNREIRDIIKNPKVIENPLNDKGKIMDIFEMPQYHKNITIELPTTDNNRKINNDHDGYQAAVLIGIRRRKMKKHKLKKLRKKMKFEWAKVRQRREVRKEKAFQSEILAIVKEGDKFSAEKYVEEKLRKANEIEIPRFWKGKRLPQFIIKEKLGMK